MPPIPRQPAGQPPDGHPDQQATVRPKDAPEPIRSGQPDAPLEGPAAETDALRGRDYVPVDEWQIDDAEHSDIAAWGNDPLPKYTDELDPAAQTEAEARIKKQTEKVSSTSHLPAA